MKTFKGILVGVVICLPFWCGVVLAVRAFAQAEPTPKPVIVVHTMSESEAKESLRETCLELAVRFSDSTGLWTDNTNALLASEEGKGYEGICVFTNKEDSVALRFLYVNQWEIYPADFK